MFGFPVPLCSHYCPDLLLFFIWARFSLQLAVFGDLGSDVYAGTSALPQD